jgi:hypothetical protein
LLALIESLRQEAEQAQGIDVTQQRLTETIQNAQALGNF